MSAVTKTARLIVPAAAVGVPRARMRGSRRAEGRLHRAVQAKPSPKLGQALGALGVNMVAFCKVDIRRATNLVSPTHEAARAHRRRCSTSAPRCTSQMSPCV
jgi:hypothetical protein